MRVKQISLSPVALLRTERARPLQVERLRGRARQVRNARLAFGDPMCVECASLGVDRVADEWDHIVPLTDGGADHESNLQGLCRQHHAEKTAREAAARANPHR